MTLASDQLKDESKLSDLGRLLIRIRSEIIQNWESKVRAELNLAKDMDRPVLIDTLPTLVDNLAEALSPGYPRQNATDTNTVAQEHGGERARLTQFDAEHVVREYQLLRAAIFESLKAHQARLNPDDTSLIRKSMDEAIRQAVSSFALAQADLREQFLATLTHDLRNPLGVIRMAAELAIDEVDNKRDLIVLLSKIIENAKRADAMIQDLLDATFVKAGGRLNLNLTNFDLLEVAKEATQYQALETGQAIELEGDPIMGFWDRSALRRSLDNLLSNAIKYGDARKPICVSVQTTEAHRIFLSVHNSGEPIPADEQESIFQVFRRAAMAKSGDRKGWGLGLALVRGVAEAHGGSIEVDSAAERGTTFILDLPIDARPYQDRAELR